MRAIPGDIWVAGITVHPNGCWSHPSKLQKSGYLKINLQGKVRWAHRVMYEWLVGPIPAGLHIDHLCRNRWCLNPGHYEAVTPHENWLRGNSISAQNAAKKRCHRGHPLDGVIRHSGGRAPSRRCLTCHREAARRYDA